MKNNFVKLIGRAVSVFLVILTLTLGITFAQDESNFQGRGILPFPSVNNSGRLEGTWNVRVTLRNCQSGDEISSFDSLTTFTSGGTLIDSTSRFPQSLKTPGHGVWRHTNGRNYKFSFKALTFDAAGSYTGYTIIRHEAVLNSRATAYESAGTLEVYAPNGTLIFTGCSTTTASRFE